MKLLHFSVVTGNPEKGGCLFHTLQSNEGLNAHGYVAGADSCGKGLQGSTFMDLRKGYVEVR